MLVNFLLRLLQEVICTSHNTVRATATATATGIQSRDALSAKPTTVQSVSLRKTRKRVQKLQVTGHRNCSNNQTQHRSSTPDILRFSKSGNNYQVSNMGHQQQQEHKPVETKPDPKETKMDKRRKSVSPIGSPSPRASLTGDDASGCSSSRSSSSSDEDASGSSHHELDIEIARKCTQSADDLLMHPQISGLDKEEEDEEAELVKSVQRHLQVSEYGGPKSPGLLHPGSSMRKKISGSLSSDEIHQRASYLAEQIQREKDVRQKNRDYLEPERQSDEHHQAGPSGIRGKSPEKVRKESVTKLVLSGPSRLAKLLKRSHSAGCSKDVPSYALFLREKAARKHGKCPATSRSSNGEEGQKSRRSKRHSPAFEDMKLRLRFLRKKQPSLSPLSDSSSTVSTGFSSHSTERLTSTSVRPSHEEAESWSKSFSQLMTSKYGSSLFKAFLAREYSEENMEFWLACQDYKASRTNKLPSKAKKIYKRFIAVQSPKEVNLDSKLRTEIRDNISHPNRSSFDLAQRKVESLLEKDCYPRFLQSPLYKDLLSQARSSTPTTSRSGDESGKSSPESNL